MLLIEQITMEVNMFQKRFLLVGVLFFAVTLFSLPKEITLSTGEWAPYTSKSLPGYGFSAEIVTAILIEMGHEPNIKFYPFKRALIMAEKQQIFATFPWFKTAERKKLFTYSEPFGSSKTKLFYFKDKLKDVKFKELKDLKKYKIGGTISYAYLEAFSKAGIKVDEASSDELGFRKLKAGRIDFFPCDELVGWQLIKKYFPGEVANFGSLEKEISSDNQYVLISKKHPDEESFLKMFNEGLKKIKANGTYDKILRKYGIK